MFDELRPPVTQDQQLVDFCERKVLCSIKLKASSTVQRAQSHPVHLPQSLPAYFRGLLFPMSTPAFTSVSAHSGGGQGAKEPDSLTAPPRSRADPPSKGDQAHEEGIARRDRPLSLTRRDVAPLTSAALHPFRTRLITPDHKSDTPPALPQPVLGEHGHPPPSQGRQ